MGDTRHTEPESHASSTGQTMTGADWLDVHFEAERPEYEAMLRSVGVQSGWHVLDAGCGGGSFLPLIAQAVGPTGRIAALDLAPDNVATVQRRLAGRPLACPVEARTGDLLALPYAADTFDALWCANTTQYLTDDELARALAEMRRVVRPGGLVAVKEADMTIENFAPGDPSLLWRLVTAVREEPQMHGMLRSPLLRRWLERAGLEAVWQRRTLVERWAPLGPVGHTLTGEIYAWFAELAEGAALPEEDRRRWRALRDPGDPKHPINSPDFHTYGGYALAVGRVPPDPVG